MTTDQLLGLQRSALIPLINAIPSRSREPTDRSHSPPDWAWICALSGWEQEEGISASHILVGAALVNQRRGVTTGGQRRQEQ
jgi:hypothetical protein